MDILNNDYNDNNDLNKLCVILFEEINKLSEYKKLTINDYMHPLDKDAFFCYISFQNITNFLSITYIIQLKDVYSRCTHDFFPILDINYTSHYNAKIKNFNKLNKQNKINVIFEGLKYIFDQRDKLIYDKKKGIYLNTEFNNLKFNFLGYKDCHNFSECVICLEQTNIKPPCKNCKNLFICYICWAKLKKKKCPLCREGNLKYRYSSDEECEDDEDDEDDDD